MENFLQKPRHNPKSFDKNPPFLHFGRFLKFYARHKKHNWIFVYITIGRKKYSSNFSILKFFIQPRSEHFGI
jgi:hypothetical protein